MSLWAYMIVTRESNIVRHQHFVNGAITSVQVKKTACTTKCGICYVCIRILNGSSDLYRGGVLTL